LADNSAIISLPAVCFMMLCMAEKNVSTASKMEVAAFFSDVTENLANL